MTEPLMTWNKKQRVWFKKMNGKQYARSCRQLRQTHPDLIDDDTQAGSVRAANQWWRLKEAELTLAARPDEKLTQQEYEDRHGWKIPTSDVQRAIVRERSKPVIGLNLSAMVTKFVDAKQVKAHSPQLSLGRWDNIRRDLKYFMEWFDPDALKTVDTVNEELLTNYRAHFDTVLVEETMSDVTAKDKFLNFKQFVRHLFENKIIERPANFDSQDLHFHIGEKEIETYSVEQVKALLAGAEGLPVKLYLMLALNCAFGPADMGELLKSEIHNGQRIIRKRSKTRKKHSKSAPMVNYKLWKATQDLLALWGDKDPSQPLALLTEDGTPLVDHDDSEGKYSKIDNVGRRFTYLVNEVLKVKWGVGIYALRKTGATMLETDHRFADLGEQYLGDKPTSVKKVHYAKPPQERLDEAIVWLGQQFGIK